MLSLEGELLIQARKVEGTSGVFFFFVCLYFGFGLFFFFNLFRVIPIAYGSSQARG